MATRQSSTNQNVSPRGQAFTVTWAGLLNGDDGAPIGYPGHSERTYQVSGTFGAAGTMIIEGSNDGGVTYSPLNNKQGTPISITAAGVYSTQDKTISSRVRVTGGDGTTNLQVVAALHHFNTPAIG